MKLTYSKPVAEIEEFALIDVFTVSDGTPTGSETVDDPEDL